MTSSLATRMITPIAIVAAVVGCSSDGGSSDAQPVKVVSTDDACELNTTEVGPGKVEFEVQNDGSAVTEFYLYQADGTAIVSEVENIGPGTSRDLEVNLTAGTYVTACKPGMEGEGIRGEFNVIDTADE